MRRRVRGVTKGSLLRMGAPGRRVSDDARDLPMFRAPRAGKKTRIPGRGSHKAKP
jgi:hypothetical protein